MTTKNYLKSARVRNFQSHKDTLVEFHPGVNVIIGPTDSGKSAFLRSLLWGMRNTPTGTAFRRKRGGKTVVDLKFADHVFVSRIKHKENLYKLGDEVFKSFKTSVPADIQTALNIDSANFQEQQDSPFLINETSGEVARYFNRIAGIEKIDVAQKTIQSEITKTNQTIGAKTEELEASKKALDSFSYLEEAEQQLTKLERNEAKKKKVETKYSSLIASCQRRLELEKEVEKGYPKEVEEKVIRLLTLHSTKEDIAIKKDAMCRDVKILTDKKTSIASFSSVAKQSKDVTKLLDLHKSREKKADKLSTLTDLVKTIDYLEVTQLSQENEIKQLHTKLHKEMKICPFCETKLK